MKLILFLTLPLLLTFSLCTKEQLSFESKGIITGLDYRKCACRGEKCGCCGDWVISIDSTAYIFKELPKSPALDLSKAKFPISILLDWKTDPDACAESWGYIQIERFKLDD